MEKYLIKLPSVNKNTISSNQSTSTTSLKQAKLKDLKGVVVLEDIDRAKLHLERKDTSQTQKLEALNALLIKHPSKEILIKTGIGKTVHRLCRNSNPEIATLSRKVYETWKNNILNKVKCPVIEVKCDLKTENFRKKARDLIFQSLKTNSDDLEFHAKVNLDSEVNVKNSHQSSEQLKSLSEYIEREIFKCFKNRILYPYKRTIRKVVFVLKYNVDIRVKVSSSQLTIPNFVKDCLQP